MGKGVTLAEMMDRLPPERRQQVETRASELIAEEVTLRELRKIAGVTQETIAHSMGTRQEGVSRLERRTDMRLSTLDSYVKAVGGTMKVIVEIPGRPPFKISDLANFELTAGAEPAGKTRVYSVPGAKVTIKTHAVSPTRSLAASVIKSLTASSSAARKLAPPTKRSNARVDRQSKA